MAFFSVLLTTILLASPAKPQIIDGYLDRVSAFPGDSIILYLNATAPASDHSISLYDLNGLAVATWNVAIFPQSTAGDRSYEKGYGYKRTEKIMVPALNSGVYLFDRKIPLVIKSRTAEITVLYPSNTVNAYSPNGGKSMYGFNSTDQSAATAVSFLRPLPLQRHAEAFLRWFQTQGFPSVGYIADADLDDYSAIRKSKLLVIAGHSEYWTLQARRNFDRFVSEGKNALILSGNTMWWQVRYNRDRNQLICYRNAKRDPVKSARLKTINWNELLLAYPITASTGTDFRLAGYGLKNDNGWNGYKIITESPLLEGSGLRKGDVLACPSDELDGAPLKGFVNGVPVLNREALGFEKAEIIGYDLVSRGGVEGVATWLVFKRTKTSGIVINTASTDWCSQRGIGDNEAIRTITRTMVTKLLRHENVFSPEMETAPGTVIN